MGERDSGSLKLGFLLSYKKMNVPAAYKYATNANLPSGILSLVAMPQKTKKKGENPSQDHPKFLQKAEKQAKNAEKPEKELLQQPKHGPANTLGLVNKDEPKIGLVNKDEPKIGLASKEEPKANLAQKDETKLGLANKEDERNGKARKFQKPEKVAPSGMFFPFKL